MSAAFLPEAPTLRPSQDAACSPAGAHTGPRAFGLGRRTSGIPQPPAPPLAAAPLGFGVRPGDCAAGLSSGQLRREGAPEAGCEKAASDTFSIGVKNCKHFLVKEKSNK